MSEANFVELCLQPRLKGTQGDIEAARTLVDAAFRIGYTQVGVLVPHMLRPLRELSEKNVIVGIIIDVGSVSELKDALLRTRDAEMVVVRAGSEKLTRAALESKKADVVMSPYSGERLNQVHARIARDNCVAIALSLRECIERRGGARSKVLSGYRECVQLWRKLSFPLVLTTEPSHVLELRCSREVEALCSLFGMHKGEVKNVLSSGESTIKRARSELPDGIEVPD